ncbi:MAG: tetratricopeptide repeat protein, partial [Acidobacteria bacterium]|nr:tetratricopeptide repeat protein [Acidobacteriota bacterium]
MKILAQTFIVLLLCNLPVYSQHENHQMPEMLKTKPMALLPNKGFVHRKVSTKNREAQAYFDQGLSLYYAFNDGDAARSFERAAELDPQLAIAHWGVALAKFPRQTGGGNPDDEKRLK